MFFVDTDSSLLLSTPNLKLFNVSFKQLEWLEQVIIMLKYPVKESWRTWVSLDSRNGIYCCFFTNALIVLVRHESDKFIFFVSFRSEGLDLSILSLPAKSTRLNLDWIVWSPTFCYNRIVKIIWDLEDISFKDVARFFFDSWHWIIIWLRCSADKT